MSNIIPPLLSNTPPPPPSIEEDEDDEFGDFIGTNNDLSYGCDNLSLPTSPEQSPKKVSIPNDLDINKNTEKYQCNHMEDLKLNTSKDYQDKRKSDLDFDSFHPPIMTCLEDLHVKDISLKPDQYYSEKVITTNNVDMPTEPLPLVGGNGTCFLKRNSEISLDDVEFIDNNLYTYTTENINKISNRDIIETLVTPNEVKLIDNSRSEVLLNGQLDNHSYKDDEIVDVIEGVKDFGNSDLSGCVEHINSIEESNKSFKKKYSEIDFRNISDIHFNEENEIGHKSSPLMAQPDLDENIDMPNTKQEKLEQLFSEPKSTERSIEIPGSDEFQEFVDSKVSAETEIASNFTSQNDHLKNDTEKLTNNVTKLSDVVPHQAKYTDINKEKNDMEHKGYEMSTHISNFDQLNQSCSNISENKSDISDNAVERNFANLISAPDASGITEEENYDDFADFTSYQNIKTDVSNSFSNIESDDFSSFAHDNKHIDCHSIPDNNYCEEDDFGEFISTSYASCSVEPSTSKSTPEMFENNSGTQEATLLLISANQAFERAKKLLEETFPVVETGCKDYHYEELEKDNSIFSLLKDITDTPALTYRWPKSASQTLLLNALNIDERNILPPWNASMPIFASNLGLQPLEPIKTEHYTHATSQSSPSVPKKLMPIEIPSAQFDWKGSGLENPLDGSQTMLLNLEQLVVSLEIPEYTPNPNSCSDNYSSSPTKELEDWDIWLKTVPKDATKAMLETNFKSDKIGPLQMQSEQFIIKSPSISNIEEKDVLPLDDFEQFSPSSPQISQTHNWSNLTPLRETYISNSNTTDISKCKKSNFDETTLELTSIPEISRKDLSGKNTPDLKNKIDSYEIYDDDEFDDFQTASNEQYSNQIFKENPLLNPNVLAPQKSTDNKSSFYDSEPLKTFTKPESDVKEELSKLELDKNISLQKGSQLKETPTEDEEFTDFHSSASILHENTGNLLPHSISEPLKPIPIYQKNNSPSSTQINWPDPGITEEEIKKFEEVFYKPPQLRKEPVKSSDRFQNTKSNIKKQPSAEEDEWSDFVSAQKVSPIHKLTVNDRERTSSPDLPLSVFNLSSIQPAKQPIPVITPQGLVQTKLSANMSNISPKIQGKTTKSAFQSMLTTPSTISSQFASQAFNFNSKSSSPKFASGQGTSGDDEEWGEFVSSPLPSQPNLNGYRQQLSWQNSAQNTAWTNFSPNIITNPRHFVQSASDMNKRVSNVTSTSKRNIIPNLVLPELDFVAPKSRTPITRKK